MPNIHVACMCTIVMQPAHATKVCKHVYIHVKTMGIQNANLVSLFMLFPCSFVVVVAMHLLP